MKDNTEITFIRIQPDHPPMVTHAAAIWQGTETYSVADKSAVVLFSTNIWLSLAELEAMAFKPQKGDYAVKKIMDFDQTGKALRKALEKENAVLITGLDDLTDCGGALAHLKLRCE